MSAPAPVHILAARRTPFGRVHGLLSGWHPVDLLAHALTVTMEDADIDPAAIDVALVGCAHPVGAQAANVGRAAVLAAGWPETLPTTTVERDAGSSQRALQLAAHTIAAGGADLAIVAGVEVMSLVPDGAPALNRQYGAVWGSGPARRYEAVGGLVPPGVAGDRLADDRGWTRAELDAEAAASRARAPSEPPWLVVTPTLVNDREQPRPALTVLIEDEALVLPDEAPPLHDPDGVVAATNVAPAGDGAGVVILASEDFVRTHDEDPVARILASAETGHDPVAVFGGGDRALATALAQAGLGADALTALEADGPHAAAVRRLIEASGVDPARGNRTGGGLARGRPLGAVGVAMVADVVGACTSDGPGFAAVVDEGADGTATATVIGW